MVCNNLHKYKPDPEKDPVHPLKVNPDPEKMYRFHYMLVALLMDATSEKPSYATVTIPNKGGWVRNLRYLWIC